MKTQSQRKTCTHRFLIILLWDCLLSPKSKLSDFRNSNLSRIIPFHAQNEVSRPSLHVHKLLTLVDLMQSPPPQHPLFPFREAPSYSNMGYTILGLILGNVAGMKYEDYVSSVILTPLAMEHTVFTKPADAASVSPAPGDFDTDLGAENL